MRRTPLRALIAIGAVLALGLVSARSAAAISFKSPTGNIRCVVDSVSARCVTVEPRQAALVGREGPAKRVAFRRLGPLPTSRVLGYGQAITEADFLCRSRRVGISCVNRITEKGYRIAREGVVLFPRQGPGPSPAPSPAPAPPPSPAPVRRCDPNYSGACVPPYPPDVDCADIGTTVYVIRDDPHGLDGDGDGVACESE
jgi:hypothetical protein